MSGIIELRLLKTDFDKLMTYALAGSFVNAINKDPGIRTQQFMKTLMLIAEREGLTNLVCRKNGELDIAEKTIWILEKLFAVYNRVALEQIPKEQNKKTKRSRKGLTGHSRR